MGNIPYNDISNSLLNSDNDSNFIIFIKYGVLIIICIIILLFTITGNNSNAYSICNNLQNQAGLYPTFYVTESQYRMCKDINISLHAHIIVD